MNQFQEFAAKTSKCIVCKTITKPSIEALSFSNMFGSTHFLDNGIISVGKYKYNPDLIIDFFENKILANTTKTDHFFITSICDNKSCMMYSAVSTLFVINNNNFARSTDVIVDNEIIMSPYENKPKDSIYFSIKNCYKQNKSEIFLSNKNESSKVITLNYIIDKKIIDSKRKINKFLTNVQLLY